MKNLIATTFVTLLGLASVACSEPSNTSEPELSNAEQAEAASAEEMLDAPVSSSDIDTKSE